MPGRVGEGTAEAATSRRTQPKASARGHAQPAGRPAVASPRPTPGWVLAACAASPAAAALALAWALRGARLGVPVADDYAFLDRLAFQRPLDWLGSMGAAYYWRPLSRQAWFSLVGPWLVHQPWLAASIHVVLLGLIALLLARLVRSLPWESPAHANAAAGLAACAPLLSEPVRALLDWPSGAQHLLGALFSVLALNEARAGRARTTAAAALAALLSHESSLAAVVLVPLAGPRRPDGRRGPWLAIALAVLAVWCAGYAAAFAHGVHLPPGAGLAALARFPAACTHVLAAMICAETATDTVQPLLLVLGVTALLFAAYALRSARARQAALPGLVAAALASAPLASLLPDWNAWRAFLPVTALALAITLSLASLRAELAAGLVLVRLIALASTQVPGPLGVAAPTTVSDLSYARLVRLQRLLESTRPIVEGASLPHGGRVGFWGAPRSMEVGFMQSLAVRVWARDSTLTFGPFGDLSAFAHPPALTIGFNMQSGRPPVRVAPAALDAVRRGMDAIRVHRDAEGDSLYQVAVALQPEPSDALSGHVLLSRARLAVSHGDAVLADSLNRLSRAYQGDSPDSFGIDAWLALRVGRFDQARRALDDALSLSPGNPFALQLERELSRLEAEHGRR